MTGRSFAIQQRAIRHRDDARQAVDREPSAGVVVEGVGDCVRRGITIERIRGDANHSSVRRVFIDRVDGCVGVCDCCCVEFIHVNQTDGVALRDERTVGGGREDGDRVTGRRFAIEQRTIRHRNDTGRAVDRESSAGVVRQRVADHISPVGVTGEGRDANQ